MKRLAGLFLAFCFLWFATAANAVVALNQVGFAQGNGSSSYSCTLNSGTCNTLSSIPSGAMVVIALWEDSGRSSAATFTDNGAGYTWNLATGCTSSGNGSPSIYWAVATSGLASGKAVTYHSGGAASTFSTFNVSYISGAAATPALDGQASHCIASGATSTASGAISPATSRARIFVGFAAAKLGGNAMAQSTNFATPPTAWGSTYNSVMVGGNLVQSSGTTAQNYTSTSTAQGGASGAALVSFTTDAPPFNPNAGAMLGLQHGSPAVQNATGCQGAPDIAVANNLCLQTFGINWWSASLPYTVDQSAAYIGGARLYYGNSFSQVGQPSNSTLNGSSVSLGENSGGYQDTLDSFAPGLGGTTTFKGKAFGGGGYFEVTASFTASNLNLGTWQAPGWTYTAECMTVTVLQACAWPGQSQPYYAAFEGDINEMFEGAFGTSINDYFSTNHLHYGPARGTDVGQDQFKISPGSASFASSHRYGLLWTPSTDTTGGTLKYYYDGTLEGTRAYSHFSFNATANGTISTGSATITTLAGPNSTVIKTPYKVYDVTANCIPGTISTWSGTTITLTGNSACNGSGSSDALTIAPPIPPAVSSATYNSGTGVIAVTMASDPGYAVGITPTYTVTSASGGNGAASISGDFSTIAGTTGTTVNLQGPTGQGAITITASNIRPPWAFGVIDVGHQDFLMGCMNSPNQCTVTNMQVWQSTDNNNISSY